MEPPSSPVREVPRPRACSNHAAASSASLPGLLSFSSSADDRPTGCQEDCSILTLGGAPRSLKIPAALELCTSSGSSARSNRDIGDADPSVSDCAASLAVPDLACHSTLEWFLLRQRQMRFQVTAAYLNLQQVCWQYLRDQLITDAPRCTRVLIYTQVLGLAVSLLIFWSIVLASSGSPRDEPCESEVISSKWLAFVFIFFAGALLNCKEVFHIVLL